jgi:hypothetical protein
MMNRAFSFRLHPSSFIPLFSALTLLVLLGRADHHNFAVAANDLAVVTTLFDGCANFHDCPHPTAVPSTGIAIAYL